MSFSSKAIKYFLNLQNPTWLPNDIEILNPYGITEVRSIIKSFYEHFYSDNTKRIFVFGINPGRFGGGLTGISFTDPVALRESCGIENNLGTRKELSSKFIYTVVKKFGGIEKFFLNVYLSALYPFAIIKDGKNYNYYDEKSLVSKMEKAIVQNVKSQIEFGARRDFVILLGKKNAEFFYGINEQYKFFKTMVVLEHPRYIMQYRLKKMNIYIKKYVNAINL